MTISCFGGRACVAILLCLAGAAVAQDLSRFGYGTMGNQAAGNRPLLVLQVEFASTPKRTVGDQNLPGFTRTPLSRSREDLNTLVFDFVNLHPKLGLFRGQTINQAFAEMSGGKFLWTRAEILPPLQLSEAETTSIEEIIEEAVLDGEKVKLHGFDTKQGRERIVRRVLAANPRFDPGAYDLDQNGRVEAHELMLLLITNWTNFPALKEGEDQGGANRVLALEQVRSVTARGMTKLDTRICFVDQYASFSTWVHELAHHLGALDLYVGFQYRAGNNSYNQRASLMGPTMSTVQDDPSMWHLDAWHKMALGWEAPRLVQLETGGGLQLAPAQRRKGGESMLLYSRAVPPDQLVQEYFIFEYRDPTPPSGPGYDGEVSGAGLFIWHVLRDKNGNIFRLKHPVQWDDEKKNDPQSVYLEGRNPAGDGYQLGGSNRDARTQFWASDRDPWSRTLPALKWRDGTKLGGQLLIRRGDVPGTLFVEWVVPADYWLDPNGPVRPNAPGLQESPWRSLAEAMNKANWGAVIHCRPGVTSETGTFNRRMTLRAEKAPITFGRR